MKQNYLLSIAVLIGAWTAHAQDLTINEMNIPTSPAFVLMDESPANIEKPTNPKAFALSLVNVWKGDGALEFTPYWFWNHPDYTFENDVENRAPIFQTLAFSVATATKSDTTHLSAGFRVQLFRKYCDADKLKQLKDSIVKYLIPINPSALQSNLESLNEARSKLLFNVELAAAYSGYSLEEQKSFAGSKLGAWLNIRYSPFCASENFPIDFVGVVRYSKTFDNANPDIPETSFLDTGLSVSYQGKRTDFQVEYVRRFNQDEGEDRDRLAGILNFQVLKGVVAVASIGKNFDEAKDIFTAFGVKFSLSNQSVH